MKYLIAFDIGNNRRRGLMVKACLKVGFRVQKSVFETFMDVEQVSLFEREAEGLIDVDHDSVRIYPLESDIDSRIRIIGVGKVVEHKIFKVV